MRTVKGNQQTAINRRKIHSYPSLGTGMGFITLGGVGRTPSFYSNMYMNLYLHIRVCTDFSINHKRDKKGRISHTSYKMHFKVTSNSIPALRSITGIQSRSKSRWDRTSPAAVRQGKSQVPGMTPKCSPGITPALG